MGRQKEFEPQLALEKAMLLFWEKGYGATSVGDLVQATGVQRYGLYGTFGDKHALFLQTLDVYLDAMVGQMVAHFEEETAAWGAIETFFAQLLTVSQTPPGQFGCLMCNSAAELAEGDPAVAERMQAYETRLTTLFEKALHNAQNAQEIGSGLEISKSARYLFMTAVGMFTFIKTSPTHSRFADNIKIALEGLKALSYA